MGLGLAILLFIPINYAAFLYSTKPITRPSPAALAKIFSTLLRIVRDRGQISTFDRI